MTRMNTSGTDPIPHSGNDLASRYHEYKDFIELGYEENPFHNPGRKFGPLTIEFLMGFGFVNYRLDTVDETVIPVINQDDIPLLLAEISKTLGDYEDMLVRNTHNDPDPLLPTLETDLLVQITRLNYDGVLDEVSLSDLIPLLYKAYNIELSRVVSDRNGIDQADHDQTISEYEDILSHLRTEYTQYLPIPTP